MEAVRYRDDTSVRLFRADESGACCKYDTDRISAALLLDEKNREQLPEECQFAFLAIEALDKIKNMEYPSAVHLFRLALRQYPAMTGVINELIRQMGKSLDDPAPNAGKEYQQLAAQLKEVLSALIEQDKYAEAMSILPQLVSLLPEDLELLRIKQRLLKKTTN